MKTKEINKYDLLAEDRINVSFVRNWLTFVSTERENISISMRTDAGMSELIDVLKQEPNGLLQAKLYQSVAKITRRAHGEFAYCDILYSSSYIEHLTKTN